MVVVLGLFTGTKYQIDGAIKLNICKPQAHPGLWLLLISVKMPCNARE